MAARRFKVLILGGGSGGITVAARLRNAGVTSIAVIEPSDKHYYQPFWTLVGAGLISKETTERSEKNVMPSGVEWIQDKVTKVSPGQNTVETEQSGAIAYDYLVVATGIKLDYQKIKGLEGHLGQNGICSIYQFQDAEKTGQMIQNFKGGTAIFTMPPMPIKCAGAPQKIMYLADDVFRKNNVREKSRIMFATAGKAIFGVSAFLPTLNEVVKRKGIELKLSHNLIEVKPQEKKAVFEVTHEINRDGQIEVKKEIETITYELLHIVPPMSVHNYIHESGLAFTSGPQEGWLKVDQYSLQHQDYPNIFGIGDVTGVPNAKTGAAVRKEAPVVVENLLAVMNNQKPTAKYDGYGSCPLVTGIGKVVLAEFGYDGKLMPSFPFDQTKERRSMWILKRYLLPKMYWYGMLKGRA